MVWLLVLNVNGTSPVRISKIYLYGQLYKYKFIFGLFFHCSRPYEEVQVRQLLQFLHALRVGFHNLLVIEKHPLVPLLHMRDVVPGVHRRSFVRDKGKKLVPRRNVLSPGTTAGSEAVAVVGVVSLSYPSSSGWLNSHSIARSKFPD